MKVIIKNAFKAVFYNYIMNIEECVNKQPPKIYNYIVNKEF